VSWPTTYAAEFAAVRAAAELAGRQIMEVYANFAAITDAPSDITTEADHLAQETILRYLAAAFPGDAFCAEEGTPTLAGLPRQGPRLWIVDPIDGSRGFARKNDEFSVMIALVVEGMIALGVVLEPARQRLTYAVRGEGCWRHDGDEAAHRRCAVSAVTEPQAATLARSRSDRPAGDQAAFGLKRFLVAYSAGIKLALVARGEADLYIATSHRFHAWDLCAGHILVEEAGGKVSNVCGEPITYPPDGRGEIRGVIASNGRLHESALARLKN
jgi:3'-phosphoadenosine 5'-phosphosulfate (PAPS) 3'-phosphatase